MLARWLYTALFYLATPLLVLRLYQRARTNPGYRERIAERFGRYPPQPPVSGALWIHAVSVGEFIASRSLIARLRETYPDEVIVITTTTPTGSERVQAALRDDIAAGRVVHVYFPYDMPHAIRRFLKRFSPRILVVMETELWPNLIHLCWRHQVPVVIANARMSARSAAGYQRFPMLTRPMLREVALIAAQSEADGERFIELGLPPASLQITGTIKFDLNITDEEFTRARALRELWGPQRRVFIAASTHPGEDEQVLEAFRLVQSELPEALLVLVPRHPERFEPVADLLDKQGWRYVRYSARAPVAPEVQVVLGDVMGELLPMLGAADVAFVGGSLEPVGGHNMLEPLAMGTPALTGPHVFNFAMVADLLTELEVLTTVTTPLGLGQAVLALLQNEAHRQQLAEQGRQVVARHRGAVDRLFMHVNRLLSGAR